LLSSDNGKFGIVTAVASTTSLTLDTSQTITAGSSYAIYYGGTEIGRNTMTTPALMTSSITTASGNLAIVPAGSDITFGNKNMSSLNGVTTKFLVLNGNGYGYTTAATNTTFLQTFDNTTNFNVYYGVEATGAVKWGSGASTSYDTRLRRTGAGTLILDNGAGSTGGAFTTDTVNVRPASNGNGIVMQIGTTGSAFSGSTPNSIDMGNSYSTTAGSNYKLRIYNDATNIFGIGASLSSLDIGVNSTSAINLYAGTTAYDTFSATVTTLGGAGTQTVTIGNTSNVANSVRIRAAKNIIRSQQPHTASGNLAYTILASDVVTQGIIAGTPTAGRLYTLPLPSSIVSAVSGIAVSDSFDLSIISAAANSITLQLPALGSETITTVGSVVIAANTSGFFRFRMTNVTGAAYGYVLYRLS